MNSETPLQRSNSQPKINPIAQIFNPLNSQNSGQDHQRVSQKVASVMSRSRSKPVLSSNHYNQNLNLLQGSVRTSQYTSVQSNQSSQNTAGRGQSKTSSNRPDISIVQKYEVDPQIWTVSRNELTTNINSSGQNNQNTTFFRSTIASHHMTTERNTQNNTFNTSQDTTYIREIRVSDNSYNIPTPQLPHTRYIVSDQPNPRASDFNSVNSLNYSQSINRGTRKDKLRLSSSKTELNNALSQPLVDNNYQQHHNLTRNYQTNTQAPNTPIYVEKNMTPVYSNKQPVNYNYPKYRTSNVKTESNQPTGNYHDIQNLNSPLFRTQQHVGTSHTPISQNNIHHNSSNKYDPFIQNLRKELFTSNQNQNQNNQHVMKQNYLNRKNMRQVSSVRNLPKTGYQNKKRNLNMNLFNNMGQNQINQPSSPLQGKHFNKISNRVMGRSKSNAVINPLNSQKIDKTEFKKMFENLELEDFANLDVNESTAFTQPQQKKSSKMNQSQNVSLTGGMVPSSLDPRTKNSLNASQGFDNLMSTQGGQVSNQKGHFQDFFENKIGHQTNSKPFQDLSIKKYKPGNILSMRKIGSQPHFVNFSPPPGGKSRSPTGRKVTRNQPPLVYNSPQKSQNLNTAGTKYFFQQNYMNGAGGVTGPQQFSLATQNSSQQQKTTYSTRGRSKSRNVSQKSSQQQNRVERNSRNPLIQNYGQKLNNTNQSLERKSSRSKFKATESTALKKKSSKARHRTRPALNQTPLNNDFKMSYIQNLRGQHAKSKNQNTTMMKKKVEFRTDFKKSFLNKKNFSIAQGSKQPFLSGSRRHQHSVNNQSQSVSRSQSRREMSRNSKNGNNLLNMRPISRKKSEKKILRARKAQRDRLNNSRNSQKLPKQQTKARPKPVVKEQISTEGFNTANEFSSPTQQFFQLVKQNKFQDALKLARKAGMEQINVNHTDQEKWCPIHYAVINKNLSAVNMLVHSGAKVDKKGKGGVTALFLANLGNNEEISKMLVENGADPELVDQKGNNALYYAVKYQKFDCVTNIFKLFGNLLMNQEVKSLVRDLCKTDQTFKSKIIGTELEEYAELNKEKFTNLLVNGILGKGTFGIVYLAEDLNQSKNSSKHIKYAVKCIQKESDQYDELWRYTLGERTVLHKAHNPFVAKLYSTLENDENLFLVMQYYKGGTLRSLLSRIKKMSESQARFYICELILAIKHLHNNLDTLYRDMKPSNIALSKDGHVGLIDFGLCKQNINFFEHTKTFCGSAAYLSPEMIKGKGHGKEMDWYGLGVIFYELVVGKPPYYDKRPDQMFKNIKKGKLDVPKKLSPEAQDFMIQLLHKKPRQRLGRYGFQQVKNHSFLSMVDWTKVLTKKYKPPFVPTRTKIQPCGTFSLKEFNVRPYHDPKQQQF